MKKKNVSLLGNKNEKMKKMKKKFIYILLYQQHQYIYFFLCIIFFSFFFCKNYGIHAYPTCSGVIGAMCPPHGPAQPQCGAPALISLYRDVDLFQMGNISPNCNLIPNPQPQEREGRTREHEESERQRKVEVCVCEKTARECVRR